MTHLDPVLREVRAGRYAQAFSALGKLPEHKQFRHQQAVLKSWVLERLGRLSEAHAVASIIAATNRSNVGERAGAECVLGRIATERGSIDRALTHFQRAESLADRAEQLEWLFWTRVGIMRILAQRSGRDSVTPIVAQLRSIATKAGDVQLTSGLHAYVGVIEGMAGLFGSAERHSFLALSLLRSEPNLWLQAVCLNTILASAFARGDVNGGLRFADDALASSNESSAADIIRAVNTNVGNLFFLQGDFDRASMHVEHAIEVLPPESDNGYGTVETLARIRLAQGRLDDCKQLLDNVAQSMRSPEDKTLYVQRHSMLTRVGLFVAEGRVQQALECAQAAVAIGRYCGDELLFILAQLARADALSSVGDAAGASAALLDIAEQIQVAPPSIRAEYHRVLACASLRGGRKRAAHRHQQIATQILTAAGNQAEADRVASSIQQASAVARTLTSAGGSERRAQDDGAILQNIAECLSTTANTAVSARLMSRILTETGACTDVSAVSENVVRTKKTFIRPRDGLKASIDMDDQNQLVVEVHPDIAAVAIVNAAKAIASAIAELQTARIASERQMTVWPSELEPERDIDAVIVGHMEETAETVRRVAKTTVLVLVLGDSGTGKEIVARAIHEYSDRAAKPFVAVNCAALPGHLLESTLFGYRRGAFTGADRDNPGLIRAAAGGTLFLDEIGELGLTLQPKLLRFLESGEIAPLGELSSIHVDVRIVCATNRNLNALVQEGLFREDLFYRINVVRLTLKPLRERRDEIPNLVTHFVAAAAREFGKGYLHVAEETMERLLLYRWPGNIRQLQNEIRRMVALVEPGATLQPDMISDEILDALPLVRPASTRRDAAAVPLDESLPAALARVETDMIKAALRHHDGRVDAAAKALGISRKGLYLKRQRLGV